VDTGFARPASKRTHHVPPARTRKALWSHSRSHNRGENDVGKTECTTRRSRALCRVRRGRPHARMHRDRTLLETRIFGVRCCNQGVRCKFLGRPGRDHDRNPGPQKGNYAVHVCECAKSMYHWMLMPREPTKTIVHEAMIGNNEHNQQP
jgi:hypothetical protein